MTRRPCRLATLLCLAVSACSSPNYPTGSLEGVVTVDGNPLPQGMVTFTPVEAGRSTPVSAEIDKEGRYASDKIPLGRVRVMFHAMKETGRMLHDAETRTDYAEMVSLVPVKYQTAGVEIEVREGKETKDFELTSK